MHRYSFLVDTYETERLKTLAVWSEFRDEDLPVRPRRDDARGRSVHEHMVHQCVSENIWFETMLEIEVDTPILPAPETRLGFIERYAEASRARWAALRTRDEDWWEAETDFFEVRRTRLWIFTRRLTHSAHHRGQWTTMLRLLGRDLHSTYGPTADTGGLMQDSAPTIYAYPNERALLEGEARGGSKADLPGPGDRAVTERPDPR